MIERYEIAGARNWRVRGSNFTPGKFGSSWALGPSTMSVPASKQSRSGDRCPLLELAVALIGAILPEK
jgi:hypothetical protein